MAALYSGYCGMGTRMASRESRMTAFSIMRTATEAPSVRKMFCAHGYDSTSVSYPQGFLPPLRRS